MELLFQNDMWHVCTSWQPRCHISSIVPRTLTLICTYQMHVNFNMYRCDRRKWAFILSQSVLTVDCSLDAAPLRR